MICTCIDWLENIDKIDSVFTISVIHGGLGYTGKQFCYCPWCGQELKEEN